jgi:hypothetical protein
MATASVQVLGVTNSAAPRLSILWSTIVLAAEILGGRRVGIRIEPATLMFYDLGSRELLRTRANPLTPEQVQRLRGVRPAGPPPRPSAGRSGSSGECRTPGSSWSPARRSPSVGSTSTARSP